MNIFAMIVRSDNLLPAHWTLRGAFAGLGTLIFTRDEGFHEACVTEQVALKKKKTELVFIRREIGQRNETYRNGWLSGLSWSPCRLYTAMWTVSRACWLVLSVLGWWPSAAARGLLTGLRRRLPPVKGSASLFIDIFQSPVQVVEWKQRNERKNSVVLPGHGLYSLLVPTLRSISSILYVRNFDWEASVFLLLAGFDGAEDVFLDIREGGCRRWEFAGGIFGGDESAVRSTKSLRSSVSGQGVSSRSEPEVADDEDQKSSATKLAGRRGVREGGVARRGAGGGGRPEELDASPRGL